MDDLSFVPIQNMSSLPSISFSSPSVILSSSTSFSTNLSPSSFLPSLALQPHIEPVGVFESSPHVYRDASPCLVPFPNSPSTRAFDSHFAGKPGAWRTEQSLPENVHRSACSSVFDCDSSLDFAAGFFSPPKTCLKKLFLLRAVLASVPPDILNKYLVVPQQEHLREQRKRKPADCSTCLSPPVKRFCYDRPESENVVVHSSCDLLLSCQQSLRTFIKSSSRQVARHLPEIEESIFLPTPSSPTSTHEALEFELDLLLTQCSAESALEPNHCTKQLEQALRNVSMQSSSSHDAELQCQNQLILLMIEELKFCIDNLHRILLTSKNDAEMFLFRLMMTLLFCLVCDQPTLAFLDKSENRKPRNWVMYTFFRTILCPLVSKTCMDLIPLSKIGLARLDTSQKKIPREVVDQILKPSLFQFCDVSKLNLRLIVGLHAVVELFPTLFKEGFGSKILSILDSFLDEAAIHHKFAGLSNEDIRKMLMCLLDFFRLFATTHSCSREQWIGPLCKCVVELERVWMVDSPDCQQFRASLSRFLCLCPNASVAFMMENSTNKDYNSLFTSIMGFRHAMPLKAAFQTLASMISPLMSPTQSFNLNSAFSDIKLVSSTGEKIPAHKVILICRSEYFRVLLGIGMLESKKDEIEIGGVDSDILGFVVRFLYNPTDFDFSELTCETLMRLLVAADRFVIDELGSLCEFHLCSRVTPTNCLDLVNLVARNLILTDVKQLLSPLACSDFAGESVIRACQSVILANLGSLSEVVDIASNPFLVDTLTCAHSLLE